MNKVIIIGRLTKDIELEATKNGTAVAKMSVAVNRKSGENADFFNVVAWKDLAENCAKYLGKGSQVGVVGSLQTRNYETSDGSKRYITEIMAQEVEFLSRKEKTEEESEPKQSKLIPEVEQDKLPF